jgi:hypothetical protein
MMHCHVQDHSDAGMATNFHVLPTRGGSLSTTCPAGTMRSSADHGTGTDEGDQHGHHEDGFVMSA